MFPAPLRDLAEKVLTAAGDEWWIVTAESCTGGLVAACLTEIAGSSRSFNRGFVTYSNAAKSNMIGVPPALIEAHGAVSAEVAEAMASGALSTFFADSADTRTAPRRAISLSITGIAGPSGGSAAKPVGLVFMASAVADVDSAIRSVQVEEHRFLGQDRSGVRESALAAGLTLLLKAITEANQGKSA
jgi:nicotinamide-nucleotide amidase